MSTPKSVLGFVSQAKIALLVLLGLSSFSIPARANPYADLLNGYYSVAPSAPNMPTPVTSAWICRTVAEDMRQRTWPVVAPQSTVSSSVRVTLANQIRAELIYLLGAQTNGRWWWSGSGREGDPNADRFILAALIDTIKELKEAGWFTSETQGWLNTIKPAVDFQRAQYGNKTTYDWSTMLAKEYPNMDAAYALIMGVAGGLYNNPDYTTSGQQFMDAIYGNVQSGGAIRYIGGTSPLNTLGNTNAVNSYTVVVIGYVSRYWTITQDTTARDVLVAMAPYFPKSLIAPGVAENSSAPWWKHRGYQMSSAGYVDVIAGISEDPQNKYVADLLLDLGSFGISDALIAVDFWRSDIVGKKPDDSLLFPDPDIGGIRGKFGRFSWVATLGENQDTFVGALLTSENLIVNSSVECLQSGGTPASYGFYAAGGNPVLAIDQTFARTGGKSAKITCTPQDRGALAISRRFLMPGHSYRVHVWYSSDSTIPASAILARFILWENSSGTAESDKYAWQTSYVTATTGGTTQISGSNLSLTASQTSSGTWTSLGLTFTAPLSGGWLSMECFNWYGNGSVWFDDLSLEDMSDGQRAIWDSALLSVTPDVGMTTLNTGTSLQTQAAYLSGNNYTKNGMVGAAGEFGTLSAKYRPQRPSDGALANWNVAQTWLLLPDRIVGRVGMTSLAAHSAPYARMRLRTESRGYAVAADTSNFTSKQLKLRLLASTFPSVSVGPAQSSDQLDSPPDADDILLQETPAPSHSYTLGQKHEIALDAHSADTVDASGYQALDSGSLSGLRVNADLSTYDLWFNTGTASANLSYTLPTLPFQTVNKLYLSVSGNTTIVEPTSGITGTSVSRSVPAGATACIVRSRNLHFNGGIEYVNPTTNLPQGFNCFAAGGSPSIATDTSVKRSGNRSLKLTCGTADRGEAAAAAWSNVAGRSYQLTMWYQTGGSMSASGVKVRLIAWKNAGSAETDKIPWSAQWITSVSGGTVDINGNNLYLAAAATSPGGWKSCTITFQLPTSVTNRLTAEYFNWYGNGTVWFDDLSLVETGNMVTNGGFEDINSATGLPQAFNCFAAGGSPVMVPDTNIKRSGTRSFQITCGTSARGEAFAAPFSNVAGKKYQLTVWYQTGGSMTANGVLSRLIAWKNSGSAEADKVPWNDSWIVASDGATTEVSGSNLHVMANSTAPGIWKCYTITIQLPPTVTSRLTTEFFNWNGNGTVWFDDISLVEVP
jgi:hypothetical protein